MDSKKINFIFKGIYMIIYPINNIKIGYSPNVLKELAIQLENIKVMTKKIKIYGYSDKNLEDIINKYSKYFISFNINLNTKEEELLINKKFEQKEKLIINNTLEIKE